MKKAVLTTVPRCLWKGLVAINFAWVTLMAAPICAAVELAQSTEQRESIDAAIAEKVNQLLYENKADTDLEKKRKEQESIELDNALNRARLEKELAVLKAEIERLVLERQALVLKWEIEHEKRQIMHEEEMLELKNKKEKLGAEIAIYQAQREKVIGEFNLVSVGLHNKVNLLKAEADRLQAEMDQFKAKNKRAEYAAEGEPTYLKEPLQTDGSLVISDRRIDLDGVITPWKANYIADRIHFYNNKDDSNPIFIVIEYSPGGSVMAGWQILRAMQDSRAPVYVVVKSYAASMAACITTLSAKSYAYPNAIILHHQPWSWCIGNVREVQEQYEKLKEYWMRLGGPIAKKMGISIKELDKRLYEKSAMGDWSEFADEAKKIKWVDHVISGIKDSSMLEMPHAADYTWEKHCRKFFGITKDPATYSDVVYLPPLGPKDFYFLYNPDNQYQIRPVK